MSIPPISGNNVIGNTQFSGISPLNASSQDGGGDSNNSRVSTVSGGGGKFASAIDQALSQLGLSPAAARGTSSASSASDSSSSTQDPQQALAVFMQNLFAALQSQTGAQAPPSNGSASGADGTNAVAGASGTSHHHHHGGGMSKLESGLQSLIQQLSPSSGQNATDPGASSASNSTLDALQQSFNGLSTADGTSESNATLTSFLQALSQNMQGAPATGNVVSTKV